MHFLDRVDLWSLLIAHAIQLTCLGGIVCLLVKLFAKNRPHLAHALWALVLLKAITPPVIAPPFPVLEWSFLQESPPAKALLDSPPSPVAPLEKHQVGVWRVVPSQQAGNSSVTDPVASSAIGSPLVSESTKAPERFSLSLAMVLLIVWSLGGGLHLLWKSACLLRFLKRLRPSLGKASARTEALFRTVVEDMKLPQRSASKAEVRTVGLLIGPAVLGLWKPKILLPVVLEQECSEEELRILLAHELTHIRRGDLWWAAVQTLATSWWWFHPLIRLCNRWFERAAEMSCDEETIARLGCKPQALCTKSIESIGAEAPITSSAYAAWGATGGCYFEKDGANYETESRISPALSALLGSRAVGHSGNVYPAQRCWALSSARG